MSRYIKTPFFLQQNGVAAYEVAEMAKFRDLSDTLNPEQVYIHRHVCDVNYKPTTSFSYPQEHQETGTD